MTRKFDILAFETMRALTGAGRGFIGFSPLKLTNPFAVILAVRTCK
jgi:hypothetical protein